MSGQPGPRTPGERQRDLLQRTYSDWGVWEEEADELHLLDYVIALEALMISPARKTRANTPEKDEAGASISKNIRTRASALFLTLEHRKRVEETVRSAYSARSTYVHGDVLTEHTGTERLTQLRELRLTIREVMLRWLILTPCDTNDLAPILDAASTDRERTIDGPLRTFFTATPPQVLPEDVTPI
ncbi:hypothetical protein ABTZ59_34555 [Streptomyces sp. NPDC094034]|uniref:hypothetical protein n=1 Tax=Streptomyces sp. NPDC094034 TaxID=3155309 RepID=UPI00332FBEC7